MNKKALRYSIQKQSVFLYDAKMYGLFPAISEQGGLFAGDYEQKKKVGGYLDENDVKKIWFPYGR